MRFLRRTAPTTVGADTPAGSDDVQDPGPARPTGKGRPTPKRRDAQRRRGPAPPPPRTQREAARFARANQPDKATRRRASAERRERMDAGDDKYLPPRDRGAVKAYVRDIVDSRRHIIGLFMPLAAVVFISVLLPQPAVRNILSLIAITMLGTMIVEGFFLGGQITRMVRARFPNETISGFKTGWYAFTRASQPRKLRVPKPRVARGANP